MIIINLNQKEQKLSKLTNGEPSWGSLPSGTNFGILECKHLPERQVSWRCLLTKETIKHAITYIFQGDDN